MACLADKKDLGMHTGMFTEAVIPLIESGVLNSRLKTLLPGKIVSSFCFGTRKLYDYITTNSRWSAWCRTRDGNGWSAWAATSATPPAMPPK